MEQSPLIEIGLPLSLIIIMGGMGLGLTPNDFYRVVKRPRAMFVGTVAQIVLIPLAAVALGLGKLMGLTPAIAVGLVIIAACPGGTTSNIFTLLARGNVALSITLTVISSTITILTIPVFTNLALSLHSMEATEQTFQLPVLRTVFTLLVVTVLPVLGGMVVRRLSLSTAQKAEPYVGRFGLVVLILIIAGIIHATRDEIVALVAQAGPAATALCIVGIGIGFATSRLLGVTRRDGLTIAIEVGTKNATIGLMVTLTLLKSAEMAIPSAVYGLVMYVFGGLLVVLGRRWSVAESPERVVDSIDR